ncbi:MAG TPA: glycosyltransferase family 4 protein, partial [Actinomycetota bacterium]|nr:glycosyltransferase family 4 protein [Actinomycetota bacterium]
TLTSKQMYTEHFRAFLLAYRPDVVHFQHTIFLGLDMITEVRRTLPEAAIVYTLHEYLPICFNDGQMIRRDGSLCDHASPRRCHECFPERSSQDFFLRERFIKSHLALVDLFVAPSRFLLERYVAWGIDRDRIRFEENGRPWAAAIESGPVRPRTRFGFFGQFSHFKGTDLAVEAMKLLQDDQRVGEFDPPPSLFLHGANLEYQTEAFQERFAGLMDAGAGSVTMKGRYRPDELAALMAAVDWVIVPSRWWENSPLVIQEAFQNRRPVICSDIGGMAEKVTPGVNGLHFSAGDAESLADAIVQAVTGEGLWERLHAGIPEVHTLQAHAGNLTRIYSELLGSESRRGIAYVGS